MHTILLWSFAQSVQGLINCRLHKKRACKFHGDIAWCDGINVNFYVYGPSLHISSMVIQASQKSGLVMVVLKNTLTSMAHGKKLPCGTLKKALYKRELL